MTWTRRPSGVIGSFSINSAENILQTLTSSVYPVFEIVLPAVSGWTPEVGDVYMGDAKEFDWTPDAPFDPLKIDNAGQRVLNARFTTFPHADRYGWIRDLFEKIDDSEAMWWKWDDDAPLMIDLDDTDLEAGYNPHFVDVNLKGKERQ